MSTNYTHIETDKELVDRILRGDRQAFAIVVKNTEKLVAQIVFKMVSNAEDRRDLAQDVYIKAYQQLSGFKFKAKLSTWIAQIAYNACLNHLEKKKLVLAGHYGTGEDGESDQEDIFFQQAGHYHNSGEKGLWQKQRTVILQQAIEALPPVYKTLITLFHQEELSYEEISEVTQLPSGTVRSYLSRARKTLKNNLLDNYKKEEL